jgi:hypothetical protein
MFFIKGLLLLLILGMIGAASIYIIENVFDYRENTRTLRKFLDDIALYYIIAAAIASLAFALFRKKK